jgi:hypothetical protein
METQEYEVSTLLTIPLSQFLVGVLLCIALLNGERALAMLTLLLLGLVSGTKRWSKMSLSGIVWNTTITTQKGFPGEILTFNIHAKNTTFLPVWLQIGVSIDDAFRPFTNDIPSGLAPNRSVYR